MKPLLYWGLKQRKMWLLWWTIGIVFFVGLRLAFYPSFKTQGAQLEQLISQLPQAVKYLISDTTDFGSPIGYLSSEVFYLILPLMLCIAAINLGSTMLAKEEKEGTLELLLARPISRGTLLLSKSLLVCIELGVLSFVTGLALVVLCKLVHMDIGLLRVAYAMTLTFLFALTVAYVSFLVTALRRLRGASIGIATFVGFGGYILSSLIGLASWLRIPAKVLPFYYYRPGDVLRGVYDWRLASYFLVVSAFSVTIAILVFKKRDIGN
jgi:ABC-2 type transport system permease protein